MRCLHTGIIILVGIAHTLMCFGRKRICRKISRFLWLSALFPGNRRILLRLYLLL